MNLNQRTFGIYAEQNLTRPDYEAEPIDGAEDELAYDEQRRIAIEAARRLLPKLGQTNIQSVMEVIVDALLNPAGKTSRTPRSPR